MPERSGRTLVAVGLIVTAILLILRLIALQRPLGEWWLALVLLVLAVIIGFAFRRGRVMEESAPVAAERSPGAPHVREFVVTDAVPALRPQVDVDGPATEEVTPPSTDVSKPAVAAGMIERTLADQERPADASQPSVPRPGPVEISGPPLDTEPAPSGAPLSETIGTEPTISSTAETQPKPTEVPSQAHIPTLGTEPEAPPTPDMPASTAALPAEEPAPAAVVPPPAEVAAAETSQPPVVEAPAAEVETAPAAPPAEAPVVEAPAVDASSAAPIHAAVVDAPVETPQAAAVETLPAASTEAAPAAPPKASRGRRAAGAGDDLKRIEGIGPKMEKALHSANITTFEALANATVDQLRTALEANGMRFAPSLPTWPRQARYLADGDEAGFDAYLKSLVAGREE